MCVSVCLCEMVSRRKRVVNVGFRRQASTLVFTLLRERWSHVCVCVQAWMFCAVYVCWDCAVLIIIIRHDCLGLGVLALSALEEDKRLQCCVVVPVKILMMHYTTSLFWQQHTGVPASQEYDAHNLLLLFKLIMNERTVWLELEQECIAVARVWVLNISKSEWDHAALVLM